jgi:hypothetical protein
MVVFCWREITYLRHFNIVQPSFVKFKGIWAQSSSCHSKASVLKRKLWFIARLAIMGLPCLENYGHRSLQKNI